MDTPVWLVNLRAVVAAVNPALDAKAYQLAVADRLRERGHQVRLEYPAPYLKEATGDGLRRGRVDLYLDNAVAVELDFVSVRRKSLEKCRRLGGPYAVVLRATKSVAVWRE